MGKNIAIILWIVGGGYILWALFSEARFWTDPHAAFGLAGGLCAVFAGALFYIYGDIEETLQGLMRKLRPEEPPVKNPGVFDVDVIKRPLPGGTSEKINAGQNEGKPRL
jgi:hypothetical protein